MKPKELGPYLLLRTLSENAVCETYRAGQHTDQEVERVVLLYLFAADPDSALWITEIAQAARRALAGLESPCLSPAIDSGDVAGAAYLAYDYIPGHSLESVLEKSHSREHPVPIEHALLITERVAQGLVAAWEHESRALHGFVVPHLVMLSNEGDVRLLGLEVAGRLRRFLADGQVREEMGRYLAPEVVPEGQPSTTDDVFSLGALLYEMLTAKRLPESPLDGVEDLIDQVGGTAGSPLPEAVAELLRGSLVPSTKRMDLKSWHAKLDELLVSGQYDVNAFNLALFLHTLFPDEIEEEVEQEDQGMPVEFSPNDVEQALAGLAAAPTEKPEAIESAEFEPPGVIIDEHETAATTDRNRTLGIAAGIVALLLASLGAYAFFGPSADSGALEATATSAELTPLTSPEGSQSLEFEPAEVVESWNEAPEAVAEETASLPPEEIDRRVQKLLSQRSADMENSLRREFEAQLATLQQQLAEAREKAAAESQNGAEVADAVGESSLDVTASAQADPSESLTLQPGTPNSAWSDPETREAAQPTELVAYSDPASTAIVNAESNEPVFTFGGQPPTPAGDESESKEDDAERTLTSQVFAAPAQTQEEPPSDSPAEPQPVVTRQPAGPIETSATESPAVQLGDLVAPGPGVLSPRIARTVQPIYPVMARQLKKKAIVTVRVLIDENGRVLEVERVGDEAGYGFDDAALQAARKSRWDPATKDGVAVKIWWTVRVAFEP